MKIVAAANVFLAIALNEPEKAEIIRITKGISLIAPRTLPFELGNALSAMLKRRTLYAENMMPIWDALQKIPVELRDVDIRMALKLASRFNIYAYDAYVLECAASFKCPLLTLDRRLSTVAHSHDIHVLEVSQ